MPSPGPSAPKKRAQYTARACNGCRRRRSKCDGVQPICGACAFYGHECSWIVDNDTSRAPTKQLVESLRVKIQVLEAEVRELQMRHRESAEVPTNRGTIGSLSVSRADPLLGGPLVPNEFRPMVHAAGQSPLTYWSQGQRPVAGGTAPSPATQTPPSSAYQYIFNIDTSIPPNEQSENIQWSLSCNWYRHLPALHGVQLSRLEHDIILDRYFKYYACWLLTLIPECFLNDMLSSLTLNPPPFPSGHYSALLHCSLLAFAAALSDDPFINQRATRERFAQHAKQLLEEELHRPSITLAQSLVMLSEYHRGAGEREKAYMYMGMSARAVRAISSKGGELPQGERTEFVPQGNNILRAWNFWSMFSQDKLMSLEYKSDFELASPRTNAFPSWGDLNIDQGLWYNNPTLGSASGTAHNSRVTEVFDQSCRLMRIAEDILVAIYSKARSGLTPEEEEAMNLHRKLEVWMNGLLPELLISDSPNTFATPLPHIIVLNICYWWLILLVHQPFYGALLDNVSFVDLSIKQCDHAARMIVKLVNLYSYWHPLRFFPRNVVQAIFAAGTMFLQQCTLLPINANEAHANAQMGIQNCIDALRIISQTWESVERLVVQLEARCQTEIGLIFT